MNEAALDVSCTDKIRERLLVQTAEPQNNRCDVAASCIGESPVAGRSVTACRKRGRRHRRGRVE